MNNKIIEKVKIIDMEPYKDFYSRINKVIRSYPNKRVEELNFRHFLGNLREEFYIEIIFNNCPQTRLEEEISTSLNPYLKVSEVDVKGLMEASVQRTVEALVPTCNCGAHAVNSNIHARYCDIDRKKK